MSTPLRLAKVFEEAREPLFGLRGDLVSSHKVIDMTRSLEEAAMSALYEENAAGGVARGVVVDVARVLDFDAGPGNRWSPDHMRRVVAAAEALKKERDHYRDEANDLERERDEAREQAALWKSLAERGEDTAPLRADLRRVGRERDELKRQAEYLRYQVEEMTSSDDVDELRATIVRQAREITALKGESA